MEELMRGPDALLHFADSIDSVLAMLALSCTRMMVAFIILPPLANQALQGRLRIGAVLLLGFYIAWGQPARAFDTYSTVQLVAMVGKEALIGLLLGFAASVVFWIAEGVGAMIDNMAGYNNVQQTNPQNGEQSTPVSNLLGQLVAAGFFMLDGFMVFIGLVLHSYHWWPLHSMGPALSEGLERFVSAHMYSYLASVAKIAAPIMLVLVLIDIAIGLIGRTAEKLEPNNLTQPIKGAVATLMLALLVSAYFDETRPLIGMRTLESQMRQWAQELGLR